MQIFYVTFFYIVVTLFLTRSLVDSARIFAATVASTKSHKYAMAPLVTELAKQGHEVTFMSPFASASVVENLTEVNVVSLLDLFEDNDWFGRSKRMKKTGALSLSPISDILGAIFKRAVVTTLESDEFKLLYNSKKYDIVILDAYLSEFLLPLAQIWNSSVILFVPSTLVPAHIHRIMGNYIDYFAYDISKSPQHDTSFLPRVLGFITGNIFEIDYIRNLAPAGEILMKKYYPNGEKLIPLTEMVKMTDMVFINGHHSFNIAKALPPNMLSVGGIHCKQAGALPKDIEEFLSDAEDGVIIFSLGSAIPSEQMPKQLVDAFANAFRRIPQKVVWRWGGKPFEGVPENVMLRSWLPQQDLAGHPKTVLQISHGGMLSTIEAVCHGIPILGLPFWGDQDANIALAVRDGYGMMLEWVGLTEEKLYEAIVEMIQNPKYTTVIKKRQELFHDRPIKPLDEAIYWVEYVLRHKGAKHLSPSNRKLNRFQVEMLDVYAALLGIVIAAVVTCLLVAFLLVKIVKRILDLIVAGRQPILKNKKVE